VKDEGKLTLPLKKEKTSPQIYYSNRPPNFRKCIHHQGKYHRLRKEERSNVAGRKGIFLGKQPRPGKSCVLRPLEKAKGKREKVFGKELRQSAAWPPASLFARGPRNTCMGEKGGG